MKRKILKVLLAFILFSICYATASLAATSVKEKVEDYNDIMYIIGSTRFDSDVIITAQRAANAGVNEAKLYVALNKANEIEDINLKTYCYNPYFDEWYEIQEEAKILTEEEFKNIEKDLNIFFVNNEEKTLEFDHNANKEDVKILTDGVKFDGKKFEIPATKFNFEFIENDTKVTVATERIIENQEEILDYGNFYIPFGISYYDKIGGTKLGETQTSKDNKIITKDLFNYEKFAQELIYVDENDVEIDFDKPITESINIYQKWLPAGALECNDATFANKTLTYNGIVSLNAKYENEIEVKLYAPNGYDTSETTIEGMEEKFDEVKELDTEKNAYYVEIPLVFKDKTEVKDINITWKEGVTSKLQVIIGTNAKFEYLVTYYYQHSGVSGLTWKKWMTPEKVVEGNKIKGPTKNPTKTLCKFVGWKTSIDGTEEFNDVVNSNLNLYAMHTYIPVTDTTEIKNLKLGEEIEANLYIKPGDYTGKTVTISADISAAPAKTVNGEKVIDPINYDEDNYIEMYDGSNWTKFENFKMTLDSDVKNNVIKIRQKLTDAVQSNEYYYTMYTIKDDKETLYTTTIKKKALAENDIVAVAGGNYLNIDDFVSGINSYSNIILKQDATVTKTIKQTLNNKNITLDLNGHVLTGNVTAKNMIEVQGDNTTLTIKNGTIKTTGQTMAAVAIGVPTRQYKSTVVLEKDAKIIVENDEGGAVSIFGDGALFELNGEIELKGTGYGISGNGAEKNQSTTININEGSKITANNAIAIYLPQLGTTNINGGTITAYTVVAMKSGTVNIKGGILTATGTKVEDTDLKPTPDGTDCTGDVIYIELNDGYAGNVNINYSAGTMESKNANILREYSANGKNATISGLEEVAGDENIRVFDFAQ